MSEHAPAHTEAPHDEKHDKPHEEKHEKPHDEKHEKPHDEGHKKEAKAPEKPHDPTHKKEAHSDDPHKKPTAADAHPPAAEPSGPGLWASMKRFFTTTVPGYMGYGRFDKDPETGTLPAAGVDTVKDLIHGEITNGPRWLIDNGKRLLKAGNTTISAVVNPLLHPLKNLVRPDKLIARILSIKFEVASAIKDVLARTGTAVKEAYKGAIGNPLTRLGQQLNRIPIEKTPLAGSTLEKVKNMAKSTKDAVFKIMGWAAAPILAPAKYIGEGLAKYIDGGRDSTVKYAA